MIQLVEIAPKIKQSYVTKFQSLDHHQSQDIYKKKKKKKNVSHCMIFFQLCGPQTQYLKKLTVGNMPHKPYQVYRELKKNEFKYASFGK